MSLSLIKDTVQQAAEAITASLDLETEIIDENLMILGGTGRYKEKRGSYEESGDLSADLVYASCLRTGNEYINFNTGDDPFYDSKEDELAEICCPIKAEGAVLGLIGLIAFTPEQRETLIGKTSELRNFLQIMAELIAGKYMVSKSNITLQNTVSSLLDSSEHQALIDNISGVSKAITEVKRRAMQVASGNSTVLITGESGTGKDLLARSIHRESPRASMPFVSVNCAAIPEMLLESELFGYEKGAFTGAEKSGKLGKFQLADGGTLFLDEIGDMPLHLQVKLLSCIQNRQVDPIGSSTPVDVDVRIIAATNKDLEEMIRQRQFREDLYFRLNVIPIHIPPLRERREDINILIDQSIEKFSSMLDKDISGIGENARRLLLDYPWPGNVREVENVVEYAINMESSALIGVESLPEKLRREAYGSNFAYQSSPDYEDAHMRQSNIDRKTVRTQQPNMSCENARTKQPNIDYENAYINQSETNLKNFHDHSTANCENARLQHLKMNCENSHTEQSTANYEKKYLLKHRLETAERDIIISCLQETGVTLEGKRRAAKMLGISEATLYRRLKTLGIKRNDVLL